MHMCSTMGLGGFSTHDASFGYWDSPTIEAVAVFFMALAGLNFSLHFVAWRRRSALVYFQNPEARAYVLTLVLAVAGNLAGWQTLPYTFNPSPGSTLSAAKHVTSPGTVLAELGRFFQARPEMALQIVFFAVFSLPIYAWIGRSPGTRLWGMSVYLVLLLLAFVLGPILILGAPVHMGPLLVTYAPCAIITFLLSFFTPSVRGGSL